MPNKFGDLYRLPSRTLHSANELFLTRPQPTFTIPRNQAPFEEMLAAKRFHAIVGCAWCLWSVHNDDRYPCQIVMEKWHKASDKEREAGRVASNEIREGWRQEKIWREYREQQKEEHEQD